MRNSLRIRRLIIGCTLIFPLLFTIGSAEDQPASGPNDQKVPAATDQKIQPGDRVAICGEGVSVPKDYAVDVQDYLQMCQPVSNVQVRVYDLGKDWKGCVQQQLLPAKINVAILIPSLGDFSPKRYKQRLTDVITLLKANGTHLIVVGTPFIMDADRDPTGAYNKMVEDAQTAAAQLASEQGVVVADIAAAMTDAAAKAKTAGSKVVVGCQNQANGTPDGYLVAAYSLLKTMGCDGNVGTITLDMQSNQATGTDGHKIDGVTNNSIDVESTRYPYCFSAANYNTNVRPVLDFVPFNQDLNQFLLVVKNAPSKRLKVTWGAKSKEFSSDDLGKGVNLAAEFPDNPFLQPFVDIDAKIATQQKFQLSDLGLEQRSLATWTQLFPEEQTTVDHLRQILNQKVDTVVGQQQGMVGSIKHEIQIQSE